MCETTQEFSVLDFSPFLDLVRKSGNEQIVGIVPLGDRGGLFSRFAPLDDSVVREVVFDDDPNVRATAAVALLHLAYEKRDQLKRDGQL